MIYWVVGLGIAFAVFWAVVSSPWVWALLITMVVLGALRRLPPTP